MKTLITINNETFIISATPQECVKLFDVLRDLRRTQHVVSHGPDGYGDDYHSGVMILDREVEVGIRVVSDSAVFTGSQWAEIQARHEAAKKQQAAA